MRKVILLAGAAALAASIPALAKNDERGRGGGKGANAEQHQGHGKGNGRAERGRGGDQRAERRGRGGDPARVRQAGSGEERGRGNGRGAERRGRGSGDKAERRLSREERRVEQALRSERRQVREARRDVRGNDERRLAIRDRRDDRRDWREWTERRIAMRDRFDDDSRRWSRSRNARGRDCPPGLARQNRFCMPPGQLRKARFVGQRLPLSDLAYNVPDRYRYRFMDDDRWLYRYDDAGTVYRFDRSSGLVSSVVPLYATGLFVGEPLPIQYRSLYQDSDDYLYRYGDNAIYRVDSETMLIEGIVALLTGGGGPGGLGSLGGLGGLGGGLGSLAGLGGLGVGDMLPSGYDAYNVPLDHRDTYYDSDEAMYRYADGNVYEVDPETRLIESVISLLT